MKTPLIIGSLVLTGCAMMPAQASVATYQARQAQANPGQILTWLKAGNQRFATGTSTHGGYPIDVRTRIADSSPKQKPLAMVLSCVDSRTSPELVFDVAVGDIFTMRVGGNVVNDDILGSLEISAAAGAKVLVVLGHTDCGGVKGACSNLQLGHMTQLLERVKPAIGMTNAMLDANPALSKEVGERVVGNRRYIAQVSHMNAVQSARQILQRSPLLREKVSRGELILIPAIYDVDSGVVRFDAPAH